MQIFTKHAKLKNFKNHAPVSYAPLEMCVPAWNVIYSIYSLVLCFIFLHCPLSGSVLIYISLLIIFCIIEYVTNKRTLNLERRSLFWFVKLPVYSIVFQHPGCQLAGNTAYFISVIVMCARSGCVVNLATCECIISEEEEPCENNHL